MDLSKFAIYKRDIVSQREKIQRTFCKTKLKRKRKNTTAKLCEIANKLF